MPTLEETRYGKEIGRDQDRYSRFIWLACVDCGKERWVRYRPDRTLSKRCRTCAKTGANNEKWKGGHIRDGQGYIYALLDPVSFFYSMVTRYNYIYEHRLVMAEYLGRCLQKWEIVHHKNGVRDDNRIENLELTMKGAHTIEHNKGYRDGYRQGYQDAQNTKMKELLEHIKLLEWQLGQKNGITT